MSTAARREGGIVSTERDTVAIAVLRERNVWPDRAGRFWNYDAEAACYHTQTSQEALRTRVPERYAEVYESPQIPADLPADSLAETPPEEVKSGAELARWYADRYPEWASHADRDGDLLFLRHGPRFITFGEHATIVAALYSQNAYATPLGGGEPIGPMYALANPTIAEHTITILRRGGHGVRILEPAQTPLTTDEVFRPARIVTLTGKE